MSTRRRATKQDVRHWRCLFYAANAAVLPPELKHLAGEEVRRYARKATPFGCSVQPEGRGQWWDIAIFEADT